MYTTHFNKDLENKKITVTRTFAAPVEKVWKAWTTPEIMDQWWAPCPWKTVTKSMDFTPGGSWHYYMLGPEGEKAHCRADYKEIQTQEYYSGIDGFSDENGVLNPDMPISDWHTQFKGRGNETDVVVVLSFKTKEETEAMLQLGFAEGFAAAHKNLDELLGSI